MDSANRNVCKEILQIQFQNHSATRMRFDKIKNGSANTKTAGQRMRRNVIQDAVENLALNRLQSNFWSLDQTPSKTAFSNPGCGVVLGRFPAERIVVGNVATDVVAQPSHFVMRRVQPLGKLARAGNSWNSRKKSFRKDINLVRKLDGDAKRKRLSLQRNLPTVKSRASAGAPFFMQLNCKSSNDPWGNPTEEPQRELYDSNLKRKIADVFERA